MPNKLTKQGITCAPHEVKCENLMVFEMRCDVGMRTWEGGVIGTLRTSESGGDKVVLVRRK